MHATASKVDIERELVRYAAEFRHDPLGFVLFAWDDVDPYDWQRELLTSLGDMLDDGSTVDEAIQYAIGSGHGIGKSALVAWLIIWAMTTEVDCKGVVTANTENQLRTKTWAELAKWYATCRFSHWFTFTATSLFSSMPKHDKTWRIDMIPWSLNNTEAFAGLHNKGRRILLIYDEASAIPDKIWEVSEGALTDEDTEIMWFAFGNPTRNTGRFRECFGRYKHRWIHKQIDSRSVPGTNKKQIDKWIADYGIDSDFVKVRVLGQFPSAGTNQFIPFTIINHSKEFVAEGYHHMPKILACDVARFGDDQTVMGIRQGRKVFKPKKYRGIDTMQTAARIIEMAVEEKPDTIVVDETGLGAGVVDRLRQLNWEVIGFNGGAAAYDPVKYKNRRAEVWGLMRDALQAGLDIPDDDNELSEELGGVEYFFTDKQQIQLESKEDMKSRGLSSPDVADFLSISFSVNPSSKASAEERGFHRRRANWRAC